jgi:hypothetical protein
MDCYDREIFGYQLTRRQDARIEEGAPGKRTDPENNLLLRCITPYSPEQSGNIERFIRF